MNLRELAVTFGMVVVGVPHVATAGGLYLPGAGAISTSRAGAAVASADDGEALAINPAGLAKTKGLTITLSAALISYAMQFQRRGTYNQIAGEDHPFVGQPFALMENNPKPPLGLGSYQPVPVVAVVWTPSGVLHNLHLALGLYAPNAYPFRNMCAKSSSGCQRYDTTEDLFANLDAPPPASRYDIMSQQAAVILPSLGAAYRIIPTVDVGIRLSAGIATLKSTTAIWGNPGNFEEKVTADGAFTSYASGYS